MKVDVALVPAAGRGTRMRPATNAVPKALLNVVDRPSIQWVVEEAARAGVTEVVVVADPEGGHIIERHFEESRFLPQLAGIKVRSVIQEEAKGLGHAVLTGRDQIGIRPFFVMLADDLLPPKHDLLGRLAGAARTGTSVVYVREVARADLPTKGVVVPGQRLSRSVMEIGAAVEKPAAGEAPSNYAINGRYLFGPEIFDRLAGLGPGRGGEIQLTDAISLLGQEGRCRAYLSDVELLDIGNPVGFLRANTILGLGHPEYGAAFRSTLSELESG